MARRILPTRLDMRKLDAYSFNICRDCIVYVIKQKNSIFSQEEILSIMHQKGVNVTGVRCPQYKATGEETAL